MSEDENVQVSYPLCPGQLIRSVELIRSSDVIVGNEDDVILWKIASQEGIALEEFTIGEIPSGFDEDVPLMEFGPDETVSVNVETNDVGGLTGFRVTDLATDEIWMNGTSFDKTEFFDVARGGDRECRN